MAKRKAPTAETLLTGRKTPVRFTQKVSHNVLERIARGESWSQICRLPGMPSQSALYPALRRCQEFAQAYAMAKEMAADTAADESVRLALEATPQTASASRVKVGALQWMAAKTAPQRYGARAEAPVHAPTRLEIRIRHFEKVTREDGSVFVREILTEDGE